MISQVLRPCCHYHQSQILPEEENTFHAELKKLLDQYDHRENSAAKPFEWLMVMYPHEVKKKR